MSPAGEGASRQLRLAAVGNAASRHLRTSAAVNFAAGRSRLSAAWECASVGPHGHGVGFSGAGKGPAGPGIGFRGAGKRPGPPVLGLAGSAKGPDGLVSRRSPGITGRLRFPLGQPAKVSQYPDPEIFRLGQCQHLEGFLNPREVLVSQQCVATLDTRFVEVWDVHYPL